VFRPCPEPSHGLLNFPQIGPLPYEAIRMPSPKHACTEICAHVVCDNFVTSARNEQTLESADVEETRVNTGENDGRPEWIRTIDLFRVKEAL
jgi:hypothetical protein